MLIKAGVDSLFPNNNLKNVFILKNISCLWINNSLNILYFVTAARKRFGNNCKNKLSTFVFNKFI